MTYEEATIWYGSIGMVIAFAVLLYALCNRDGRIHHFSPATVTLAMLIMIIIWPAFVVWMICLRCRR